jgi:hypothetical protein
MSRDSGRYDIDDVDGNPALCAEICEALLDCAFDVRMPLLFRRGVTPAQVAKKLFGADISNIKDTQEQFNAIKAGAVLCLYFYYPTKYRTNHDSDCTFEADVARGFNGHVGEGEISGSVSLEHVGTNYPELSMSDGWNASVNWKLRYCPLCGAKLLPEQTTKK